MNSGIDEKMKNKGEEVENLGRALVNLENLHLTHIGELPVLKPWPKVTATTNNDEIKAYEMDLKKLTIDYLNTLDLSKTKMKPEFKQQYETDWKLILNHVKIHSLSLDDLYLWKRIFKQFYNY